MHCTVITSWFFLFGQALAAENGPTQFIAINGGYSPDSNYRMFQDDLRAIQHTLAKGKAEVFDASGTGSFYVQFDERGEYQRNATGTITLGNEPIGFDVQPARKSDVLKAFETQAKNANPLTVFFGDHGSPDGLLLWGESMLSPSQWQEAQRNMPVEKPVRSIHFHCNSEVMLADPSKRKPPEKIEAMSEYLAKVYRPNSCGLAFSKHDELTASPDTPLDWKKSFLNKVLEEIPTPSLSKLWDRLSTENGFNSTPTLTSDLVVEDVFPALCSPLLKGFKNESGGLSPGSHGANTPRPEGNASVCTNQALKQIMDELNKQHGLARQQSEEIEQILGELSVKVLQKKFPDEFEGWAKAQDEIDVLRKELFGKESKGKVSPTVVAGFEEKIEKLHSKFRNIDLELNSTRKGFKNKEEMLAEYRKKEFQDWLKGREGKDRFPAFLDTILAGEVGIPLNQQDIFKLSEEYQEKLHHVTQARKTELLRMLRRKRAFVESELKRRKSIQKIAQIQRLYESIRKCENSSLN